MSLHNGLDRCTRRDRTGWLGGFQKPRESVKFSEEIVASGCRKENQLRETGKSVT